MKVIYEANDGTKFEAKEDCMNYEATESMYEKANLIEELLDEADRDCDSFFYTKRKVTDFIIENIKEINMILTSARIFESLEGIEYVAIDDPVNSCNKCSFKNVKHIEGDSCCESRKVLDCLENDIIWVKK